MPEDGLQRFQLQGRGNAEHAAITIKTAVGYVQQTTFGNQRGVFQKNGDVTENVSTYLYVLLWFDQTKIID